MSELAVPEVAIDELYTQRNATDRAAAVRAVATPVVAAYLRDLASRAREMPSDVGLLREFLLREADALDGGAS